ncbi:response regulator transcription factor [Bacillus coahuilensis]|uniref:response regulator transcription factor n=1 Tax=Bacillus coahuilensis TaxID=408580 RepID=UPI0001851370|nr:response regulator [Bacillus coahuilensis]
MKLLLVDDELHVREGIRLLGRWEELQITEIVEAENGQQAVQIIETSSPEIIITDMKMPVMGGGKLLEWLNETECPSIRIVLTGFDQYEYMRKAVQHGSFDYLLKPIDPDLLHEVLTKAVSAVQLQQPKGEVVAEDYKDQTITITMRKVEEYLKEYYHEDIKLQDIADTFYISREYISRKFKEHFHLTITDYLVDLRMKKAMELLDRTNLKVYEIAEKVGYVDDKYFRKVFKKFAGVTPNDYRQKDKNGKRLKS